VKRKITGVKIENRRTHASLLILLSDYVRPRDILEMTGDSYTPSNTCQRERERERERWTDTERSFLSGRIYHISDVSDLCFVSVFSRRECYV